MVKIRGEHVPNELVGLEEPSAYIHALFSYTRKMDEKKAKMGKEKAQQMVQEKVEELGPEMAPFASSCASHV